MSIEQKRWAQRARELQFDQLGIVRKQAEGWRTGLAGLTALLSAVLLIKGRDTITGLESWTRIVIAGLFVMAFTMLVAATLQALRAASGTPGEEILLTGEELQLWTRRETRIVGQRIQWAAGLTVAALITVIAAVGLTGSDLKRSRLNRSLRSSVRMVRSVEK